MSESMSLFESARTSSVDRPLAERLRPKTIEQMVGQPRLLSGQAQWRKQLEQGVKKPGYRLPSLILFGPPGCGKTTLARIVCSDPQVFTENCHAIETGAKALKEACERAKQRQWLDKKRTVIFVDEIHRLNRAQQDVLLASLESGDVSLIGATTENPSHTLNPALISRCQVLAFDPLSEQDLNALIDRGFSEMRSNADQWLSAEARPKLMTLADGDARKLLNAIEWLAQSESDLNPNTPLTAAQLEERLGALVLRFDRAGEAHYDTISALIKSIRGSDADAALYYLARLVRVQEDVAFLARRLMILASEDVGNADPRALQVAVACMEAVTKVGWPEASIIFAQAVTYLACAPKSNASYLGIQKALECVDRTGSLPIPLALRSSKTSMSKQLGYGQGYRYSHDGERGFVAQEFLPASLKGTEFLELSERGFEKTMQQYQEWIKKSGEPQG